MYYIKSDLNCIERLIFSIQIVKVTSKPTCDIFINNQMIVISYQLSIMYPVAIDLLDRVFKNSRSELAQAVTFLAYIPEASVPNLGQYTSYPDWRLSGFPQPLHTILR
jgi:hypothetical protein